jgi:hypothetical protein
MRRLENCGSLLLTVGSGCFFTSSPDRLRPLIAELIAELLKLNRLLGFPL